MIVVDPELGVGNSGTLSDDQIVTRPAQHRRVFLASLGAGAATVAVVGLGACATRSGSSTGSRRDDSDPRDPDSSKVGKPGLYSGPNFAGVFNARVGLPVDWGSTANCRGPDGRSATWNFDHLEVVQPGGGLPPGLRIENRRIVGIPTRAGTWNLRLRFAGIKCNNSSYNDEIQTMQIITEGSSAPSSVR